MKKLKNFGNKVLTILKVKVKVRTILGNVIYDGSFKGKIALLFRAHSL